MQKQVGDCIRQLRRARGLTQDAAAEKAGINGKYFGAIERGEVNVTVSTLGRVSAAFEVPVTALFARPVASEQDDRDEVTRLVRAIVERGDGDQLARLRRFLEQVFR